MKKNLAAVAGTALSLVACAPELPKAQVPRVDKPDIMVTGETFDGEPGTALLDDSYSDLKALQEHCNDLTRKFGAKYKEVYGVGISTTYTLKDGTIISKNSEKFVPPEELPLMRAPNNERIWVCVARKENNVPTWSTVQPKQWASNQPKQ